MVPPDNSAKRALRCLDLTALGDDDRDETIIALCARAVTPHGAVASICTWPRFVPLAREALAGTGVPVAAVANFPAGGGDIDAARDEVRRLAEVGADEIDLVMPYTHWLEGERTLARDLVAACRDACGEAVLLKVILETGAFPSPGAIREAASAMIEEGADFLKTSTGKRTPAATLGAARVLMEAIAEARAPARSSGRPVGFKAAGGIRSVTEAAAYLALADRILGPEWARPETFRIGASRLLDDLLESLDAHPGARPPDGGDGRRGEATA